MGLLKKKISDIKTPEFQCPKCNTPFSGRPEKCQNCGLIFTWDTYDKNSRSDTNLPEKFGNETFKGTDQKIVISGHFLTFTQHKLKFRFNFDDICFLSFAEPLSNKIGFLFIGINKKIYQFGSAYLSFKNKDRDKIYTLYQRMKKQVNPTVQTFSATQSVGPYMCIDAEHKLVYFSGYPIVDYSVIDSFDMSVNNQSIIEGSMGSAALGGFLFGATGAVIGSATSKRVTSHISSINITVRTTMLDMPSINFVLTNHSTHPAANGNIMQNAQDIISILNIIINECKKDNLPKTDTTATSSADEILKFKNLLDQGIISQEEFDAKKKQLLGL